MKLIYKAIIISSILFSAAPVSAFTQDDYILKQHSVSERAGFSSNFTALKNIYSTLEKKIQEHESNFRNTAYQDAGRELIQARKALTAAESYFKKGDNQNTFSYLKNAAQYLKNTGLYLLPSRNVEARGMYLDADTIPKTREGVRELVRQLKKANFNVIYPEVFSRGYSIMDNPVSDTAPDFEKAGFDVLQYLVVEAHSYGIEVHPWIWTFRVKSPLYESSFLKKYPDLIARREHYRFEDREPLFLSPAEPKARELMLNYLRFITQKYDIDGFLLDYIRYDETLGDDILSKKYFRQYYLAKYKKEPPKVMKEGTADFVEWHLWRESQVTKFVEAANKSLKALKKDLKIGVAVFRTEKEGRLTKMQDWRHWGNNSLIDYICPMLYTDNTKDLNDWINSETDLNTRKEFLFPSLGALRFNTDDDLIPLAGLIHERNIPGFNIFSLAHYSTENFDELAKGIFRKPAVSPNKNIAVSIKLVLDETSSWLKEAQKQKNAPVNELKNLAFKLDVTRNTLNDMKINNYNSLKKQLDDIQNLAITYHRSKAFSKEFLGDIQDELNYAKGLLDIYIKEKEKAGKKFPPKLPPFAVLNEVKEKQQENIYRTTITFKPDGKPDKPVWNNRMPLRSFFWDNGLAYGNQETVVKVTYDSSNLYLLFENFENAFMQTVSKADKRDDKRLLSDDNIGFYLEHDNNTYLFAVNINNIRYDSRNGEPAWNAEWQSATQLLDNSWIAELKIPVSQFRINTDTIKNMKVNFTRYRPQELNPAMVWATGSENNKIVQKAGTLVLN